MYFETDRLAREEKLEVFVPTETFTCSKCGTTVHFTAKMDEAMAVTCPKCGHKVQVIIESRKVA